MSEAFENNREVIRFPVEDAFDIETARDDEVLHRFINRFVHPSQTKGRSREELANFILELGGTKEPDELSETMKKTRERIINIRFSTAGLSNSEYDALINPKNKKYDDGFAALYYALISTRANASDLGDERAALNVLMELRVASIKLGLHRSDNWVVAANLLSQDMD
jgi:hypothetical protein